MPKNTIVSYEHHSLRVGDTFKNSKGKEFIFTEKNLNALEQFHGEGTPYFKLINKGVKFNQHVGVLQIGSLTIEILPKADSINKSESHWRNMLINMMRIVGLFPIHAPSNSQLNLKSNFLLDLYFEMFIQEVEHLCRMGLVKQYRRIEGNKYALKGNIKFAQHLQQNLIHRERFFVQHSTYDSHHSLHQILYKTIQLLQRINTYETLNSRIGRLILDFPEMPDIKINESTFEKIHLNRKTESYKSALDISRLLLLNYHPNIQSGQNDVLALMFNMNYLWEKFIYISLRKNLPPEYEIKAEPQKNFWKRNTSIRRDSFMKPDICIKINDRVIILDTKWKNLYKNDSPSIQDLRQMYVYLKYYKATESYLVYPGAETKIQGEYYNSEGGISSDTCGILKIPISLDIKIFQENINRMILGEIH